MKTEMADLMSSTDELAINRIRVYPNPAIYLIFIDADELLKRIIMGR